MKPKKNWILYLSPVMLTGSFLSVASCAKNDGGNTEKPEIKPDEPIVDNTPSFTIGQATTITLGNNSVSQTIVGKNLPKNQDSYSLIKNNENGNNEVIITGWSIASTNNTDQITINFEKNFSPGTYTLKVNDSDAEIVIVIQPKPEDKVPSFDSGQSTLVILGDNSVSHTIMGKNLPNDSSLYYLTKENIEITNGWSIKVNENQVVITFESSFINGNYILKIKDSDAAIAITVEPKPIQKIPSFDPNQSIVVKLSDTSVSKTITGKDLPSDKDSYSLIKNNESITSGWTITGGGNQIALTLESSFSDGEYILKIKNSDSTIAIKVEPKPTIPNPDKPTEPKDPYSYQPHLYKKMPVIRIDTADKSNTFATERKNIYFEDSKGFWEFEKQEFPYQDATITVENLDDNITKSNLSAQVKVRGNTTTIYDKKPFRIKFTDKQDMLSLNGNHSFKDWVLLANWRDVSMLRNNVGLYLGQFLYKDQGLYASDFVNVELYLNGEYWGVYLLCEQNEVAVDRVNIEKPVTDYQGTDMGYLLEMDYYAKFEQPLEKFSITYEDTGTSFNYTIKSKIYNENQRDFIQKYLENIYKICNRVINKKECWEFTNDKKNIVQSATITDPIEALKKVLDLDSAVAVCILQEIICDYDINNSSFYMSIDLSPTGDGKLHFQAPWDFDTSFGIIDELPHFGDDDTGSFIDYWWTNNEWLKLMYKSDLIKEMIKNKWANMKKYKVQDRILSYIDEISSLYVGYYQKNYEKWKNIGPYIEEEYLKVKDNPDENIKAVWEDLYLSKDANYGCDTEKQAADYLKKWLTERFSTLDSLWEIKTSK